jgi:hypothetical protein
MKYLSNKNTMKVQMLYLRYLYQSSNQEVTHLPSVIKLSEASWHDLTNLSRDIRDATGCRIVRALMGCREFPKAQQRPEPKTTRDVSAFSESIIPRAWQNSQILRLKMLLKIAASTIASRFRLPYLFSFFFSTSNILFENIFCTHIVIKRRKL